MHFSVGCLFESHRHIGLGVCRVRLHTVLAAELFEAAAAELKPNPSRTASQRFRMFLALSSELHQVRARFHIAAQQSAEGHPGASCADLLVSVLGFRVIAGFRVLGFKGEVPHRRPAKRGRPPMGVLCLPAAERLTVWGLGFMAGVRA